MPTSGLMGAALLFSCLFVGAVAGLCGAKVLRSWVIGSTPVGFVLYWAAALGHSIAEYGPLPSTSEGSSLHTADDLLQVALVLAGLCLVSSLAGASAGRVVHLMFREM